jgi:hypothetical protein
MRRVIWLKKYVITDMPMRRRRTKPTRTNSKNAICATKLFDSINSLVPKLPVFVENELKVLLIVYIN